MSFPRPLESPSYVLWEITLGCNLRCDHCAASAGRPRDNELSSEEALAVCDQLADLGVPAVCLMGGEPLVRRDWTEIAKRLRASGIEVGIITNGVRFDEGIQQTIADLGICQVGVSLDAADPDLHDALRGRPGTHRKVLETIGAISRMPLAHRTIITSVRRSNFGQLPALANWISTNVGGAGFSWMINITSCHDPDRFDVADLLDEQGMMALADFIQQTRKDLGGRVDVSGTHDLGYFSRRFDDLHGFEWSGCVAGLETLGIRSDGDVTGCLIMDDDFIEGNVRERTLSELWNDPDGFAYNRRFTESMLEGACAGCEHGPVCRGGCRDHAVAFTGSRFHYPFCLHRLERERGSNSTDDND